MHHTLFKIAWANIARRKTQSWILGISLLLSVLLFTTTIGLLQSMYRPFDLFFNQMQASHLLLTFDHRQHDLPAMCSWLNKQPEVQAVGPATAFYSSERSVLFRETEIDKIIQLHEYQPDSKLDRVTILEGEQTATPPLGSLWIPNHLANTHGIRLGDTLHIPTQNGAYPLQVSAIIADPHFANSLMNPTRAWVGAGSLPFFVPLAQQQEVALGIRLHESSQIDALWTRFNQQFVFSGQMLPYDLFKSVFLSFYNIIASVLLVFSVLAMVITAVLLSTTLARSIRNNYTLIGTYKALGYTRQNIIGLYTLQNLLLLALALLIGLPLSYALVQWALQSLASSVGMMQVGIHFGLPLLIALLFFTLSVGGLSLWRARQAARIDPIDAIRFGSPVQQFRQLPFSAWLHRLSVPVFVSLRMIVAYPKRLLFTAFGVAFTTFLLLFATTLSHSFDQMRENRTLWGFEDADLFVKRNQAIAIPLRHEALFPLLRKDSSMGAAVPYNWVNATIPGTSENAPENLTGKAFMGDLAETGLENLEGRHPQEAQEVALCVLTAKMYDKKLGDTMQLFIEGQLQDFSVTGIYQDVSNLGRGFRLNYTALEQLNPLSQPEWYLLRAKADTNLDDWKTNLQQQFGETIKIEASVTERQDIISLVTSMKATMVLISAFFLLVAAVLLFNDTVANIDDFRRSFGIFQTVGMTTAQMRWALLLKALLTSALGLLIGIPLAVIASPIVLNQLMAGLGLVEFPYATTLPGIVLALVTLLALIAASVWLASGRMLRIRVRALVTE